MAPVEVREIAAELNARARDVAGRYAPRVPGSYVLGDQYFTLNPGRADRRVGSFVINLGGDLKGRYRDFACNSNELAGGGDMLNLIQLSLRCDMKTAVQEALAFLGWDNPTAQTEQARAAAAERRKLEKNRQDRDRRKADQARVGAARHIFMSAEPRVAGTPVEQYLRGRGLDIRRLGRQPGALRYAPHCRYYEQHGDTGEIIEGEGPAMVAAIVGQTHTILGVHRTWLSMDGGPVNYTKSRLLRQPKKVLGTKRGCAIRLWKGLGPKGGKPKALHHREHGQHVFITEGIEDGLTVALARPASDVWVAIDVGNMAAIWLPEQVTEVTLVADNDEGPQAQAALQRAIDAHGAAGRVVKVYRSRRHKDVNDQIMAGGM